MKTDYPEFEDIEIMLIDKKERIWGYVVGCNFDVGVSVVEAANKDNYLYCFIGKSSPNRTNQNTNTCDSKIFMETIYQLERGYLNLDTLMKDIWSGGEPSSGVCPFNQ